MIHAMPGALLVAAAATCFSATKPYIVFVVVDDLGWSDTQFLQSGKGTYATPNIQQLAREGMVFTDAYAAAPICSPTRASLLTGKSPAALRLTAHIPENPAADQKRIPSDASVLPAATGDRLPLEEVTFAEILRQDGYQTAYIGKWHLAGSGAALRKEEQGTLLPGFHPDRQGFDLNIGGCAYGLPPSYFSPYQNATIPDGPNGEYLTDRLTDESIRYIQSHAAEPFLVYLNYYSVHRPHQPKPELVDETYGERADYAAMIGAVDQNIGRLMAALADAGLEENTLVIFTSDNGSLEGNAPLRGEKGSLWEGGLRVPLILRWPGVIAPDSRCTEPVISYDFLPTLLDATGSRQPIPDSVEGMSLMPLLKGGSGFERKQPLIWHFPHYHHDGAMASALRDGPWKLIHSYTEQNAKLYNLKDDPGEQHDLFQALPEKAAPLQKQLFQYLEKVDAAMPPPALRAKR